METKTKNTQFRLPTRNEFESLNKYPSRWNKEKKGLEISNDKGDTLFIPASGECYNTSTYGVGYGCYWSSTVYKDNSDDAYNLFFNQHLKDTAQSDRCDMYTIRLVSDTPFKGGVEFGGIWWKAENEEGYYSYTEALEKFSK